MAYILKWIIVISSYKETVTTYLWKAEVRYFIYIFSYYRFWQNSKALYYRFAEYFFQG